MSTSGMSDPIAPPPPRRRRSWLLIASLCLNIALIPVLAAVVIRATHRDTEIGTGGVLAPRSIMEALPDERRPIAGIIAAHTPKILALRKASGMTRWNAFKVLGAPDYTPAKLAAALDAVHAADAALEAESIAMMHDSLAVLTPEERLAMVEKVKRRNRSWLFRMFRPRPQ
jgi:uncharacterized membrane protein